MAPDDKMKSVDEDVVATQTTDASQPDLAQTSCACVPHFVYHFDIVHFAVEDRLYRLPKRNLQYSTFFGDMFGPPKGEFSFTVPKDGGSSNEESTDPGGRKGQIGLCGEGESDKNPIVLEGIKKGAFDALLEVLYPTDIYATVNLTASQWMSVLDLAHMWGFERIRKVATDHISIGSMDPFQKVLLAHKYEISEWYEDVYTGLAMRANTMSVEEARTVGFEFAFKLERVRAEGYASGISRCTSEVYRSRFANNNCSVTCGGTSSKNGAPNETQLRAIVRRVFALDRSTVRSSSVSSQPESRSPSVTKEAVEAIGEVGGWNL